MKYERYRGLFVSQDQTLWRISIMQEADAPFSVTEVSMAGEEPLVIEWEDTSKEDVICASSATLRLISPGDRTFEDLYTIQPGMIRLDVFREGEIYWSGMIDPEFYEEPYTTNQDYEVELTFSDFGILDRLKYDLSGIQNCSTLISYILSNSGINFSTINDDFTSTSVPGAYGSILAQLDVRSDNFYDEDGEPCTLEEVLEGVLQPLALRIQQRNGTIWIYDLNGFYHYSPVIKTDWYSDDQVMSVDKVINNATIKFSPYSSDTLLSGETTYPGEILEDKSNITNSGYPYYTYYVDYDPDNKVNGGWDYYYQSFTIFYCTGLTSKDTGFASIGSNAYYFHIQPLLGAQESDGVAYMLYSGGHGDLSTGWPQRKGGYPGTNHTVSSHSTLFTSKRVYLPKLSSEEQGIHLIRLTQELMIDARYNPFTQSGKYNEGDNYDAIDTYMNFVLIAADITLYSESGRALCHYRNSSVAQGENVGSVNIYTMGEWAAGESSFGECWLSWYDPDDYKEKSGVQGWSKNRHTIGIKPVGIFPSFKEQEGQLLPYPDQSGYLEIRLYAGFQSYDHGETFGTMKKVTDKKLFDRIRWMLYKAPKVEVVRRNITMSGAELEDIEYNSFINRAAKEDLSIETICGTSEKPCPTARGIFLNHSTGVQVLTMTRAGRVTQAEQLFLGTLYSQFADRKTVLSGTVTLHSGNLRLFRDAMQPGKKFICTEEVQDLQAATSSIKIIELRPDEYEDIS